MRRLVASSVLLIILGSVSHLLAQSSSGTSSTAPSTDPTTQAPDQNTPTPDSNAQPSDPGSQGTAGTQGAAGTQGTAGAQGAPGQTPRPAPQTPGVRSYGLAVGDKVTVGGYGSVRYETNSLHEPKPAGFDFRRFVLTTDATPNDRLQAYIEVEFERFAEIEVERGFERTRTGTAFTEDLEGGNGGEVSIEQMWGQFKFGTPLSVRFGQILIPLGRFNINHDDDRWDIPRRTLVDRNVPIIPVPAAWTELGFGGVGSLNVGKSGQLSYQGYVVNGATLDFAVEKAIESEANEPGVIKLASEFALGRGPVNGEGGVRAAGWRVMYSPALNYEIAVSNYEGGYTPDFFEPSDAHLSSWGIDGLFKHKTFALEGEWIHTHFGDLNGVEQAFINAVTGSTGIAPLAGADGTEAEFALTNLSPNRYGFWLEGRYSFWPMKWTKNTLAKGFEDPQLTAVLRFERATVKDLIDEISIENGEISIGEPQTLRQQRFTIGLAYRPIQSVVFSVAMEHNWRLDGPVLLFPFGQPSQAYTSLLAGLAFGF
jgi:hypothetical protein